MKIKCPVCHGHGVLPPNPVPNSAPWPNCHNCNGKGWIKK